MIIDFIMQILGLSNPFYDFTANITRISSILYTMQKNATALQYKEIEEKADAIKRMIGIPIASNSQCLRNLAQKKQAVLTALPHSGEKAQIETMEKEMHQALHHMIKEILHIHGIAKHLANQNYKKLAPELSVQIVHAQHYAEKMRARSHIELQAYKKTPKRMVSEKKASH